jgi:GT2 family glycosyltransferase
MIKIERMHWAVPPLVYIVTLTWNQCRDTLDCLASLHELTYPNFQILVVDNGSIDGTVEAVRVQYPAVELLVNEQNLGFQGGFNAGIRYAHQQGAEFVLVMNNDTTVQPDMLDELMDYAGLPDVGIVSPKIFYFAEPTRIWSVGGDCHPVTFEMTHKGDNQIDAGQWAEVIERDFLVGCAMLMTRLLLQRVGLFDTGFHPIYYEDVDLCVRARREDLRLLLVPTARMWHKVSASGGGSGSPRERYLMARHSVRYFRKYVRGWKWLIVVPYRLGSALKTTLRLMRQGRTASVGAYWRGLRDGLRMPITTTGERL